MRSENRLAVMSAVAGAARPMRVDEIAAAVGFDILGCAPIVYGLRQEGRLLGIPHGRRMLYALPEVARSYGALPPCSITRAPGTVGPFGRVCGAPVPECTA